VFENLPADGKVHLLVGRSQVLRTKGPFKRVSLTQPDVVVDNEVDPTNILLTAKKAGATQLIVWDEKDHSQVVDVVVDVDLAALTEQVKRNFPNADVQLSAANGTLVARGRVGNLAVAEQITELLGRVREGAELHGAGRRAAGDAPGPVRRGVPVGHRPPWA
jgi:pilus assembly protein CpaC